MAEGSSGGGANLSDLVKEMVKEMDANEFYARGDMYDEAAEEPWFKIEISLGQDDGGGGIMSFAASQGSLRKPWSEFQRLHYLLLTDEFGCDKAVKDQLPNLPAGPGTPSDTTVGGEGSGDIASDLTVYLNALLAVPAVVQSQVFSGFLDEQSRRAAAAAAASALEDDATAGESDRSSSPLGGVSGGNGSGYGGEKGPHEPETAIDFLVQPFDYTSAYLPRRGKHTEQIDVLRGESVVWKFEVMDHLDINFSVVFRPHPVAIPSNLSAFCGDDSYADKNGYRHLDGIAQTEVGKTAGRPPSPGPKNGSRAGFSEEATVRAESSDKGSGTRHLGSGWWGGGSSRGGGDKGEEDDGGDGSGVDGMRRSGARGDEEGEAPKEEMAHLPTRYSTGGGVPVQGSFTCPADGTCILRWDNSYSRLRGKRLCFVMESATPQTMRAAIEAAGAADHKRRTTLTRSAAAQMILDSDGSGRARVTVTAVGAGNEEDVNGEGNDNGSGRAGRADGSHDSGGYYRFGRVRRVAAALLRDLETMVDVRSDSVGNGSSFSSGRFVRGNRTEGGGGGESHGGGSSEFRRSSGKPGGNVEIEGVQKLVERFEQLEDEVASASARRAQCEAQAKVLLATLQKANTRADRLTRTLEETEEQLAETRAILEEAEASRDEEARKGTAASARLQASEEQLLRAKRERDLLQAERNVWHVARSGIQEEMVKVVAALELERHRHEDASRALAKSHESRAHAEAEAARLTRRLEEERGGVGGIRAALATEREAARLAREEAEDARTAVAELDAAVAELGAQKRVLVAGLRARERALGDRCAAAEARAEESAMMRRAAETRVKELEEDAKRREAVQADAEVRLQRLRAEKKILLAEIRRGVGSGGVGGGAGVGVGDGGAGGGGAGGDDASSVLSGGGGGRDGLGDVEEGDGGVEASPPLLDTAQDNKATLKQLSRQLVLLRERRHHLLEDLHSNPDNPSAQRLKVDVERAVRNLEIRIRRLLAVVAGGGGSAGGAGSVVSSPGSASPTSSYGKGLGVGAATQGKADLDASYLLEAPPRLSSATATATAADEAETERYSV